MTYRPCPWVRLEGRKLARVPPGPLPPYVAARSVIVRGLAGNRPGMQRRRGAVAASHVGRASRARRASSGEAEMVRRWSARASRAEGRRASERPRQAAAPATRVACAAESRAQRVSAARRGRRDARAQTQEPARGAGARAFPPRRPARAAGGRGGAPARGGGQAEERDAAPPRRPPPRSSDAPWPRQRGCVVGGAKSGGCRFLGHQCSAVVLPSGIFFFRIK